MSPGRTPDGSGGAARRSTPDGPAADDRSADARDDRSAERNLQDAELPVRAERRRRLQSLAGVTVRGSDGRTVGRVRDVYLHDATGELAAITVLPRQLSARSVLIPASAIAALPEPPEDPAAPPATADDGAAARDAGTAEEGAVSADAATTTADDAALADEGAIAEEDSAEQGGDHVLHLLVDTDTAKAGARPPLTLHVTPDGLREAVAALHLEEGSART